MSTRRGVTAVLPLLERAGPFNEVPEDYTYEDALHSLTNLKILVVGAGGLGCEILKNLALTGFKDIHVIDMDTIDVSNLNRQFLFRAHDVGLPKAVIAARCIVERMQDPELKITPYFGTIQLKPFEYYTQFNVVVCGLDLVEARRWINATLIALADEGNIIPMIDGGTEGFRGQLRVILPTLSLCYECTLNLVAPKTTYPICTIANTPRLPEHCIEWASQIEWQRVHPDTKFDADIMEHVDWMFVTSKKRANEYSITGVTRRLTLGVVKNIVPAIASTNAIVAASCCNEAFKFVTDSNPLLDNYMMYLGDDSVYTYLYKNEKSPDCAVCGHVVRSVEVPEWWLLQDFVDEVTTKRDIQMTQPSLASKNASLYLRNPPSLEEFTRPNLRKKLLSLIQEGDEVLVTDPNLPISLKLRVKFTDSMKYIE